MKHRGLNVFGIGIVLGLNACGPNGLTPTVMGSNPGVAARMMVIAATFERDRRQGGMAGVTAGIDKCYAAATFPVVNIMGVRDCMVLDYVAYRTDVTIGRTAFGMALPFFDDRVAMARLQRYAPFAQLEPQSRMLRYLNDSNGLVQQDLAQINAEPVYRGGLYRGLARHL